MNDVWEKCLLNRPVGQKERQAIKRYENNKQKVEDDEYMPVLNYYKYFGFSIDEDNPF